jgi:hypothetical protein
VFFGKLFSIYVVSLTSQCNPTTKAFKMLTLEMIREMLQDRRVPLVADATGLHYNTIRQIRDTPEANPTYKVVKALSDYLEGK